MIIAVNCDRPDRRRPLYGPFSHDITAAILVFTNNEKFSLLESVNIYHHLGKSIWFPRQRFSARNSKLRWGQRNSWSFRPEVKYCRPPNNSLLELPLTDAQSVSRHSNLMKLNCTAKYVCRWSSTLYLRYGSGIFGKAYLAWSKLSKCLVQLIKILRLSNMSRLYVKRSTISLALWQGLANWYLQKPCYVFIRHLYFLIFVIVLWCGISLVNKILINWTF